MYEIKRAEKNYIDQVKVGERILDIDFDVVSKYKDLKAAEAAVASLRMSHDRAMAQGASPEDVEKVVNTYGQAVVALITLVFGEENTIYILGFFQQKEEEALRQTMPYITECFMPAVNAMAEERRQESASKYAQTKLNRAQTRKIKKQLDRQNKGKV